MSDVRASLQLVKHPPIDYYSLEMLKSVDFYRAHRHVSNILLNVKV